MRREAVTTRRAYFGELREFSQAPAASCLPYSLFSPGFARIRVGTMVALWPSDIMRTALALFLVAHGLIHLLGTAKALGWADLPQLTQPISTTAGMLWLAAAMLFMIAASLLFTWPHAWSMVAVTAVMVSMGVIVPSWTDAWAGGVANIVVLMAIVWPPTGS